MKSDKSVSPAIFISVIVIFDLDDTLYDERSYVESGLRAVSAFGYDRFGWDPDASLRFMIDILDRKGRGAIFDCWLRSQGKATRKLVEACVGVYRHHLPAIKLNDQAKQLLPRLFQQSLYVVTDGHKVAQQKKVEALGIERLFKKIFITHRYGIKNAKPSIYCFDRIREIERCEWEEVVYVGDNPEKDFVNLNICGARTIRVLTGAHKNKIAKAGFDAMHHIESLGDLTFLLKEWGMNV